MEMLATSVELTKSGCSLSSGSQHLFAPDNPVTEEAKKADPNAKSNYETALEAAKNDQNRDENRSVKTLQDAIDYLKTIPNS